MNNKDVEHIINRNGQIFYIVVIATINMWVEKKSLSTVAHSYYTVLLTWSAYIILIPGNSPSEKLSTSNCFF